MPAMSRPRAGEPSAAISSTDTTRRRTPYSRDQKGEADATPAPHAIHISKPDDMASVSWSTRNRWVVLAMASGACAAFNGVFAKLTTNNLTTNIAHGVSGLIGLSELEGVIEIVVRTLFFGLNIVFNGVMWTLFTQALAKGSSTTQVSIMNTSTNFVVTAILGFMIFSEALPPLWWAGATLLVAGNVIIGRKNDENNEDENARENDPAIELDYRNESSSISPGNPEYGGS